MEARAVIKRGPPRVLYAAALVGAAIAGLLVVWFYAGWRGVRAQQYAVLHEADGLAEQRAIELARELRGQLEALAKRETDRPYFHYQNLFHDPRSSIAWSLAPSPLADGTEDPLVLGYFQVDGKAHVTTPTINDDVPDLSEAKRLAENRAFRAEVGRSLAAALAPTSQHPTLVADATVPKQKKRPKPVAQHDAQDDTPQQDAGATNSGSASGVTIAIDPNTYAQNSLSNVYFQRQSNSSFGNKADNWGKNDNYKAMNPEQQQEEPIQVTLRPPEQKPVQAKPTQNVDETVVRNAPVLITVSPLEWKTMPFAGAAGLLAVRHVETPDGVLAQGFVIDRATMTSWLASRVGDMVAQLKTEGGTATEIAPGWHLSVTPNPRVAMQASLDASRVARDFLIQFVLVGFFATLAGVLAVLLVARSEKLARERSQFAAAAAHELRTPLAGLQLYGDMLADGLGDPTKERDYAKRISEEASRLGRVVSNVLGFSQLERGSLSVDAQLGDVGAAVCELAERATPALERAGAVLETDLDPTLRARFDRDGLARVVGNLLDNAEKYSRGAGDRTITLATKDLGDAIEVSVRDRGPGVDEQTKLFQAFARGVAPDGPAGLGLGLALSQSLARAMGGDLEHRKPEGGGAQFVLRLPRA